MVTSTKGLISLLIPTKKYLKAYTERKLGSQILVLDREKCDTIMEKLYDLLEHHQDPDRLQNQRLSRHYTDHIKIYLPVRTFKMRGHCLNATNIVRLNRFIEKEVKEKAFDKMDDLMEHLPNATANLPHLRRKLGIDSEDWSDESLLKEYYRNRKKRGLPLLYQK